MHRSIISKIHSCCNLKHNIFKFGKIEYSIFTVQLERHLTLHYQILQLLLASLVCYMDLWQREREGGGRSVSFNSRHLKFWSGLMVFYMIIETSLSQITKYHSKRSIPSYPIYQLECTCMAKHTILGKQANCSSVTRMTCMNLTINC